MKKKKDNFLIGFYTIGFLFLNQWSGPLLVGVSTVLVYLHFVWDTHLIHQRGRENTRLCVTMAIYYTYGYSHN